MEAYSSGIEGSSFQMLRLGNDNVLGERAVGVDADDLHVLADVRLADAALQTLAAGHVHLGGNEVAFLHAGDFIADSFHDAAEFVARNQRRMNAALRPLVPLVDVQVGAADGGHLDLDQHVGRAEFWFGNFADFGARRRLGLHNCNHSIRHEMTLKPQWRAATVGPASSGGVGQTPNFNMQLHASAPCRPLTSLDRIACDIYRSTS